MTLIFLATIQTHKHGYIVMQPNMSKWFLPELLPCITELCNRSLQQGWLPQSQKHATITPILKKKGLDENDVASFRPISNLTFLSKVIERMVNRQLMDFLESHQLLPRFQSGFRSRPRTMFVVLALPASTSFVSCVSCVDHFHPMHVHHLYMHSFQAGWITATACSQASQTLSFGCYSQCCVSLPDSVREDGSTIRSQKSSATSFTGCLFDNESTSSWVFWSTSACPTWLLRT